MYNLFRNAAWLYDTDNRDNLLDDIPFYIDYAKQQNGEILELGCGTGRVALKLAENDFHVTGLDLSQEMLDIFRSKLKKRPNLKQNITIIHGNMANFSLNKKFSMIIAPFRAFQALTDENDIKNSLNCIKNHLAENGIFIINVFDPKPERMTEENWCYLETIQWERLDEKTGNYIVKKHWGDKIDTKNQIIYPHFAFEITYPDNKTERITENLQLKYYFQNQLQMLIENADMEIIETFSWYDKTPLGGREIIFICKKISV